MKSLVSAKEEEGRETKTALNHGELRQSLRSPWLIFFISLFYCLSASNSVKGQVQPEVSFTQGAVKRTTLENGMTVLLKEKHDLGLVDFFLCIRAGSARETGRLGSGCAHFLEHMLFKGTKTRRPKEVYREIESLGGNINASTGYDYTGIKISVPAEFANQALAVLADMVSNATIPEAELEKERKVVLNEIRLSNDDPQRYISRLLWQTAYSVHPYKYPILGQEGLFNGLTREDLLDFYQNNYTPENMVLAVVGDIASKELLEQIKTAFRDFKRKAGLKPKPLSEPRQTSLRKAEVEFTSGHTYLLVGFHSVALSDKDCCALDILATILGEGKSSRLYKTICRQKQWVYDISVTNYTPQQPGLFVVSCFLAEKFRKQVTEEIWKQINKLRKQGITPDELEAAKNKIISQIMFYYQTQQAQAQDIALNEAYTNNYRFTEEYIQNLQQVKLDEVIRVANEYLREDALNTVALFPRADLAQETSPESISSDLVIGEENLTGESGPLGICSAPEAGAEQITRHRLNNGLTLLFKEDKQLPLVSVKIVFKGGLRAEHREINGLSNLAAGMLEKGTKSKKAEEISEFIESKGAQISYFSGNNSFGLSLDLLSKDLEPLLSLLADLVIDAGFPSKELNREKKKSLASLESMEDDIFDSGMKLLRETLYPKHPYGLLTIGNQSSLHKLRRRDLVEFHQRFCVGNNAVLAVFGDLDTERVVADVERLFAELKPGEYPGISSPKQEKETGVQIATKSLLKQQSLLLFGFAGTNVFSSDRYALELVCELLSQPSGRLFSSIREQGGFAYTLGAYSVVGLDPGYIVIYVATTPENTEPVKERVLQQLSLLQQETLKTEELARVKRMLLTKNVLGRETLASCALESSLDELYGLGYEHYLGYSQQINKLTAQDIKRCLNQFFDLSNYSLVIVNPAQSPE